MDFCEVFQNFKQKKVPDSFRLFSLMVENTQNPSFIIMNSDQLFTSLYPDILSNKQEILQNVTGIS